MTKTQYRKSLEMTDRNKTRIYVSIVAVIVAMSAGLAGITYSNYVYDPFDDPAYAQNLIPPGEHGDSPASYPDNVMVSHSHASYPYYTFQQIVDMADIIAIGNITDKGSHYEQSEINDMFGYVYTMYAVAVDRQFKGPHVQELLYTVSGGVTEEMILIDDGFMLEKGDRVMLFLTENERFDNMTTYTPITLDGEYKILNNTHVSKYGESITIPLEDFVDLTREKLTG